MAQKKRKQVNSAYLKKELASIDDLFDALNKDKRLPTFAEHFMFCLSLGIAENVNLKELYPSLHKRLTVWLQAHNRRLKLANNRK